MSNGNDGDHPVPRTNSGQTAIQACDKEDDNENPERWYSAPMHVLFNQLGSLCTRFNKRIKGTQFQQHFVQSVVSSMRGMSFPLLYLSGMLFPKHFWASSTKDPSAILGVMPISCYRKRKIIQMDSLQNFRSVGLMPLHRLRQLALTTTSWHMCLIL